MAGVLPYASLARPEGVGKDSVPVGAITCAVFAQGRVFSILGNVMGWATHCMICAGALRDEDSTGWQQADK